MTYDGVTHRATIEPAPPASNTTSRLVVGGAIADLARQLHHRDSWGFTTGDTVDRRSSRPVDPSTGVWRGAITITVDAGHRRLGRDDPPPEPKTGDRVAAKVT